MFLLRFALKLGAGLLIPALMIALLTACSSGRSTQASATLFHTTLKTTDGKLQLQVTVNPNQRGSNEFTVTVQEMVTGQSPSNISVQLSTIMLDMGMEGNSMALQPTNEGQFSAQDNLAMPGNWEIRIVVRTQDGRLHTASFHLRIPSY